MSNEKIQQALEAARKIAAERVTNKLAWLMPHRKQLEIFALGGKYRLGFWVTPKARAVS